MTKKENKQKTIRTKPTEWRRFLAVTLPVVVLGVLLDQAVKHWATQALREGSRVLIPKILRLTYVENTGAAFSMLKGGRTFFLILTAAALVIGFYVLLCVRLRWSGFWALSFVMSGAVGNLIDRVRFGYVVDMFEPIFVRFAVFNVADVFLTLGGIALALYIVFWHDKPTNGKVDS